MFVADSKTDDRAVLDCDVCVIATGAIGLVTDCFGTPRVRCGARAAFEPV